MLRTNKTRVTEFILLGLSDEPKIQCILFAFILITYLIILCGNSLIICLINIDRSLQTPMYFFLANLSFLDICFSSSTIPRMLIDLLSATKNISLAECATQMYFSLSLGACECILLAIMAYDRYIAICYPLHYRTIMSRPVCLRTACCTWIGGFTLSISLVAVTLNIDVCGHNEINHFLCEIPEILSLGCEKILMAEVIVFSVGVLVLMTPAIFIVMSYIKIILTILKIASSSGKQKAFSTCGSHIMVVTIFYGSAIAAYMKPRSMSSPKTDKTVAVFYLIVIPMLNPLIYTLRNKDIKQVINKLKIKCLKIL